MMRLGIIVAFIVIVFDQITKKIATKYLESEILIISDFLNFVLVYNKGISFSMFETQSLLGPWIFSLIALAIICGLFFWLKNAESKIISVSLGLLIGGAFGNVLDRVFVGAVVDFIDFHKFGYHWPAFNLADVAIFVGVFIIVCINLFFSSKVKRSS